MRVRRFETLSQQDLAQFLCVAAVCGMIWWQVGHSDTVYGAQNTTGLLFFEGERRGRLSSACMGIARMGGTGDRCACVGGSARSAGHAVLTLPSCLPPSLPAASDMQRCSWPSAQCSKVGRPACTCSACLVARQLRCRMQINPAN